MLHFSRDPVENYRTVHGAYRNILSLMANSSTIYIECKDYLEEQRGLTVDSFLPKQSQNFM